PSKYEHWLLIITTNGQSLTSSDSVVEEPGRSVTLSCYVSGFSMGSHWMHWIRQKPGKGLEWIGYIDTGTSTYFAQSLQGQFSISKDTSKNMLMLNKKNMWFKVLNCKRNPLKVEMPLSIFPVTECPSGNQFQIGCMSTGLQRDLPFEWFDSNNVKLTSGVVQFPATLRDEAYAKMSFITVKKEDFNNDNYFKCKVGNGSPHVTKIDVAWSTFTVTIHRPVAKDLFIYKKAKIQCDITGGNKMEVEGAQLSWKFQGKPVNDTHITSDEVKQTEELYIKTSTLTLDDSDWFSGAEVECFTKRDQDTISKKASIKHGDESCSVQIYTPNDNVPSVEKIPLVCQVNSSSLGDVYIMWKKSDGSFVEGTITAADSGGKFVFSFLTVTSEEYNNVITCAVKHANMKNLNSPKMATASKSKDNWEDDYNSLWSTASSFIFLFL
uniref:Ig-like domain-containing protein n=1 Tax=Astyanax mexicanus TaxID=7994 RepID=A0A8B9K1C1_ASTMX